MPVTKPRRARFQPAHARRREILDAAAGLVAEQGFERTTIEQVAAEAGIAKGTVYLYFPAKQSLLAGLQEDLARTFLDGPFQMMADESRTWLDRLDALVKRRLEVRLAHSKLYHELFHVHTVPDGEEPLKQVRALMAEILQRGTEAGEFQVEDVTVTADFLLHAAGGACEHVDRSDTAEVLQTIEQVQKLFHRVVCASLDGSARRLSSRAEHETPLADDRTPRPGQAAATKSARQVEHVT